ncbi:MAG: hypothetical protein ACE5FM_00035 [Methyloligellaceae bacterium]
MSLTRSVTELNEIPVDELRTIIRATERALGADSREAEIFRRQLARRSKRKGGFVTVCVRRETRDLIRQLVRAMERVEPSNCVRGYEAIDSAIRDKIERLAHGR